MCPNNSGSLSTSISGLPFAFSAQVKVIGPNGYSYTQNIPGGWTETLTGLAPGTYTLQPQLVPSVQLVPSAMAPRNMFFPAQESYIVTVAPQNIINQTIPYSNQPPANIIVGGLAISISGLMSGVPVNLSAQVKVTGPNGYFSSLIIAAGTTEAITGLAPGNYTLLPQPVKFPTSVTVNEINVPAQESYIVTVAPQNIITQNIPYITQGILNTLRISISGLPNNLSAQVKVTGPYGYSSSISIFGGTIWGATSIPSGTYILEPQPAGESSPEWFPDWFPVEKSYTVTVSGIGVPKIIPYSHHT